MRERCFPPDKSPFERKTPPWARSDDDNEVSDA
jgi:hypothetical protein